jgi:hypothetical protein
VLSARLDAVARAWCLDPTDADSAFTIPPGWIKERPADVPRDKTTAQEQVNTDRALAEAFARQHHLDAVATGGGKRAFAMVDGKGVFIGQSVDKFELLAVTKTNAVFGLREVRAELRLPEGAAQITREHAPAAGEARTDPQDVLHK